MSSPEEKAEVSKQEQGGAHALAVAAAELLESYDASSGDLQICAHLLNDAAKLADHAALYRRLSQKPEGS